MGDDSWKLLFWNFQHGLQVVSASLRVSPSSAVATACITLRRYLVTSGLRGLCKSLAWAVAPSCKREDFKLRKWLPNRKTRGPQGYKWGTGGRKDESRRISRGHLFVGSQKEHERLLSRPIAQAARENLRSRELQEGQRDLLDVLTSIGHFWGPPGVTEVPHPHTASKRSYPALSMV